MQNNSTHNSTEVKSLWVVTILNYRDICYQMHISLPLVLCWLAYTLYADSNDWIFVISCISALFILIAIYEISRLFIRNFPENHYSQVTLYPFAGLSDLNRRMVINGNPDPSRLSNTIRLECIPAIIMASIAVMIYLISFDISNELLTITFFGATILAISALLPITPFPGGYLLQVSWADKEQYKKSLTSSKFILMFALFIITSLLNSITFSILCCTYLAVTVEHYLFEKSRITTQGCFVKDALLEIDRLLCFQHGVLTESITLQALQSFQPFFPIMLNNKLLGILKRTDLFKYAHQQNKLSMSELTHKDFAVVNELTSLATALEILHQNGLDFLIVYSAVDPEKLLGILTKDKLFEFMLLRAKRMDQDQAEITSNGVDF